MGIRNFSSRGYSEKRKSWRMLVIGLLIVCLLWWGYRKFITITLAKGNTALVAGDYDRAESCFQRVSALPLSNSRGRDGLGALALLRDNPEAAKAHFKIVLEKKPSGWGGDPQMVIKTFIANGQYRAGSIYREFLTQWRSQDDLKDSYIDFATLALGARQPKLAGQFLDKAPPSAPRLDALRQKLDTIQRQGYMQIMVDRNGAPMIIHDLKTDAPRYASPKLFSGWPTLVPEEGFIDRWPQVAWETRVQTTIDINLQKAAYQAFGKYNGTMILMDPNSGDVLAAYGTEGLDPFSTSFEPGSVIKVLTLGSLLKEDPDLSQYAPKKYPSSMMIGGKIFYDWTTHGQLASVEEGMAVSCNLMFAQMGIDLGWPKLGSDLKMLFDQPLAANLLPNWASLGQVLRDPENAYELGRFAIGLDMMASTSLGIVLIPAAVANGGVLPHPRLISGYMNMQGETIGAQQKSDLGAVFQAKHVEQLKITMIAAVNNPRGTARRAKLDFVEAAIKTGTSGNRPFDSVLIGMFPVHRPKIVFGFYLKSGGKAEIHGSRVAKNLQEQIKALAPEYLD